MKKTFTPFFIFLFIVSLQIASAKVASRESILLEEALQLKKKGKLNEAYVKYSELNVYQDSVYEKRYANKIVPLRESYNLEELELENKRQQNRLFMLIATCISVLVLIGGIYYFYLRRNHGILLKSKKKMEEAKLLAEVSERNKSLFLSNMSHEIRTPLNALVGFSDLLTTNEVDDSLREQCNDIIHLNSELLLKLINDVVDISCFDITNMKFNMQSCDVVALCRNVIDTIDKIKQTQAELSFSTELKQQVLYTDTSRLQQLLINLLMNATKFTQTGRILLTLERIGDEVRFSVTDTGCGIPLDRQSKIFNRFEKLNEGVQGYGLGLSICELIVKRMGGRIWIDPAYTDGARFVFTHPLVKEEQV